MQEAGASVGRRAVGKTPGEADRERPAHQTISGEDADLRKITKGFKTYQDLYHIARLNGAVVSTLASRERGPVSNAGELLLV